MPLRRVPLWGVALAVVRATSFALAKPSPPDPQMQAVLDALRDLEARTQASAAYATLFSSYAGSGDDQALVGFARETLPTLETHLAHVQKLTGSK